MPLRIAAAVLILLSSLAAQSHRHVCEEELLPDQVVDLIKDKFPGWHFQKLSELNDDFQALWLKQHPEQCPGFAAGHFQSPSRTSYALLLVRSEAAQSGSKLVFVSEGQPRKWQAKILEEEGLSYYYQAVYTSPAAPHKSGLDTFRFITFDVGTTLYRWAEGRFHSQSVSDPATPRQ